MAAATNASAPISTIDSSNSSNINSGDKKEHKDDGKHLVNGSHEDAADELTALLASMPPSIDHLPPVCMPFTFFAYHFVEK
jgi:hypothetical protein